MSSASCQAEFTQQIQTYNNVVLVSLSLTLFKVLAFRRYSTSLSRYKMGAGILKIALAISLWTVWWPRCPSDCTCEDFIAIYPAVALLIGIAWLHDGWFRGERERLQRETFGQGNCSEGTGDGIVFAAVATTDKEDHHIIAVAEKV
jgi:hypothetical protein